MKRLGSLKREDDRQEPSGWEKAFMALGAAFSVAVFAFLAYQAFTAPPGGPPEVRVLWTETTASGDVMVVVQLENRGGAGLLSAEVEVRCAEPAPSLTFHNVPAEGRREGRVLCPPGTGTPEASLASYVAA